jgi:small subunit ribosomal protein S20
VATHKSARKRARQSIRRRARNRHVRSSVKGAVKRVRGAFESDDAAEAQAAVRGAEGVLRRAASKGVIPKKRASRQISRLARRANRLGSPS